MSLWAWVLVSSFVVDGYTGFHLARGGWQDQIWQTPVGLASLGVSTELGPWGSVAVRFLFFDILQGSRHTPAYRPYLQEASATLHLPGHWHLTLGHQPLSFKDGFFLTDIGDGMDAVRLSGPLTGGQASLFYVLQGNRFFGDHPTGDFAGVYWSSRLLDLYTALRTDGTGVLWLGARAEMQRGSLETVAEVAGVHTADQWFPAFQGVLRWHTPAGRLGAGGYYLHHHWQKPTSYPQVMDGFYNGWTAFGEALNWVVLPLRLAPWVSSAGLQDPYAVYWPDPHNLWVVNVHLRRPFGGPVALRWDLFAYGLSEDPETGEAWPFLGPELAWTATVEHQGFTVGLSAGVFFPKEILGTEAVAWSVRLWSFAPFGAPWDGE